jgi:predicted DNA-binding transcriptional regulator AlpA
VDAVCKSLGISQATYYRYKSPEQSTEALLPLSI